MFTSDHATTADAPVYEREKTQNAKKPPVASAERRFVRYTLAETQGPNSLPVTLEKWICRSSRLLGIGLFMISVGGAGWMVIDLL